jgi:uncharacterized repeat protein (TIGR01451 family)
MASITNTLIASHTIGIHQIGGPAVFEDYNLFFNTPTPQAGTIKSGGHSLTGDPKFVDPATDNYQLGGGSVVIDRGTNLGITVDIQGNVRPQGGGFDIGAYENTGPLFISKRGPSKAIEGEVATYTLTITNSGPGNIINLVITDALPAAANYVSGSGGTKVVANRQHIVGGFGIDFR